jgi:hypothetical protein
VFCYSIRRQTKTDLGGVKLEFSNFELCQNPQGSIKHVMSSPVSRENIQRGQERPKVEKPALEPLAY